MCSLEGFDSSGVRLEPYFLVELDLLSTSTSTVAFYVGYLQVVAEDLRMMFV